MRIMTETDEMELAKRRTFKFEWKFIGDLMDKIPQKILDLDCEIIQSGEFRFDNNKLNAVYLALYPSRIRGLGTPDKLKFEYVDGEFIFRSIYIYPEDDWDYDGKIEHRYDQHMNLLSKYKYIIRKDLQIPSLDCGKVAGTKIYDAQNPGNVGGHYIIYDLPGKFINLYDNGLISETHFIRSRNRTDDFNNVSHLESSYFNTDFSELFNFCDKRKNVSLLKGKFSSVLNNFDKEIDILHIDCDLYQSYKDCLDKLYTKVVSGGCIIFDEYYSLKYPGPRIAVDEFFANKKGHFEKYTTPEGFERWCFIKG